MYDFNSNKNKIAELFSHPRDSSQVLDGEEVTVLHNEIASQSYVFQLHVFALKSQVKSLETQVSKSLSSHIYLKSRVLIFVTCLYDLKASPQLWKQHLNSSIEHVYLSCSISKVRKQL